MTRQFVITVMLACGAAGAAQADTTVLNTNLFLFGLDVGSTEFTVSNESTLSETVTWSFPTSLDGSTFSLFDLTTGTTANASSDFGAGTYKLTYAVGGIGWTNIDATVTPAVTATAPEMDPSSAMAALTLLGFGVTALRGRTATRRR